MAYTFLVPIDLAKNELRNAALQNLSSDPSTPATGQVYFKTVGNIIRYYDGSSWQTVGTSTGTVTSVALSVPAFLSVSGSPITSSGTLAVTANSQSANLVLRSGDAGGVPSFTSLTAADIPSLAASKITSGQLALARGGTNADLSATGGSKQVLQQASSGAAITVATMDHTFVSDFDAQVRTSSLDQMTAPAADVSWNSRKLTSLATCTTADEAANKGYVDAVAQGLSPKPSARLATTAVLASYTYANGTAGVGATITFSATGVNVVDGFTTALNDYVLVKNEVNAQYNGLYKVTTVGVGGGSPVAGIWTRAVEMDANTEYVGAFLYVDQGTVNGTTQWACTNTSAPTVGTTNITFTQFAGAGSFTFNAPLSATGTAVSLNLNARLVNNGGNLDLAASIVTPGSYTLVTVDTYGRATAGADLTSGTGLVTKTASGTFTARTLTGTSARVSVTNGDGVAGNPTVDIDSAYVGQATITTLGTVATGTWNATTIDPTKGGTGLSSCTLGSILYGSAANTYALLTGNTTTTRNFLRQTGNGSVSAAPAWDTVTKTDVGLSAVENTALSTWAGTSNITTLGTVSTGTWSATTIALNKGGTGQTTAILARQALVATGIYTAAGSGSGTTITIAQATHLLGTASNSYLDMEVVLYDISANPAVQVYADVSINTSTGAVTITFASSQTLTNYQVTIIGK